MCYEEFVADKMGIDEDVSVCCTLCQRSFHSKKRLLCGTDEPIPDKGFLCKLCTQQKQYPEVLKRINKRCKKYPTVYTYHTSNLTNY